MEMMTLPSYLRLAVVMIKKYAPPASARTLVDSEDAIDRVASAVMEGDRGYDPARHASRSTYRAYRAKWAIKDYLKGLAGNPPLGRLPDIADRRTPEPVDAMIRHEEEESRVRYVTALMAGLSPLQRDCVSLHYVAGMLPVEISEHLGMRRQAVRDAIGRGMHRLKLAAGVLP